MSPIKNDSVCRKFNKNRYYFRFIDQFMRPTSSIIHRIWEIASLIYLLLKACGTITTLDQYRKSLAWLPHHLLEREHEKGAVDWWFAHDYCNYFFFISFRIWIFSSLYNKFPNEAYHSPVNDNLKILLIRSSCSFLFYSNKCPLFMGIIIQYTQNSLRLVLQAIEKIHSNSEAIHAVLLSLTYGSCFAHCS